MRLYQGDLERETVFAEHPWEMAVAWEKQGASYLHVVDLDGAAAGGLVNLDALREILERVSIPVQAGGGVRSGDDVERLLALGVDRVILGTSALAGEAFTREVLRDFAARVIVSVDTRGGEIAVRGWTERLGRSIEEVVEHLLSCGAERVIHTDIYRDGTLRGHDAQVLGAIMDRGLGIIAAGGISSRDDLLRLRSLSPRGLEGAIIGRALYAGGLHLPDLIDLEED